MPTDPERPPKPLPRLDAMRKAAAAASDRPVPDPQEANRRRARPLLERAGELVAQWRAEGRTREEIMAEFGKIIGAPAMPRPSERSAAARDARAKVRGRLPVNSAYSAAWTGAAWSGLLVLRAGLLGRHVKTFQHSAEDGGLFRTLEELDIKFWEWFAAPGDEAVKALLQFAPEPGDK